MESEKDYKAGLISLIDKMKKYKGLRKEFPDNRDAVLGETYDQLFDTAIMVLEQYRWYFDRILSLHEKLNPDPLTWEELHEYIGKPVFRVSNNGFKEWIIITELRINAQGYVVIDDESAFLFLTCNKFFRQEEGVL